MFTGTCAVGGNNVIVGWYSQNYNQNQVQLYSTAENNSPLMWTYQYPADGNTQYQDLPVTSAITDDGSYFVVGTWGSSTYRSPQVAVFSSSTSTPVYTLQTPGSVFSADIFSTGGSSPSLYAVACGKHVHANVFGDGGDLYSVQVL